MHILFLILLVFVISAAVAGISAAPWVPTKPSQRKRLLKNLTLSDTEIIVDLGCGDGSMLFAVSRLYPNATCIGYDISLLPLCIGWMRKLLGGKRYCNVHIRFGNLFRINLTDADVIFVFLMAKAYPRLVTMFQDTLKNTCRVVVEAWPLPDVIPSQVINEENMLTVYIYEGKSFKK